MPLLFAVTLFVSASLLFMVQPMVGKMILPLLGGSPAVWNACMVFFQALLLLGYLYAHHVSTKYEPKKQWGVHMLVMLAPIAAMAVAVAITHRTPIAVAAGLAPSGDVSPILSVMALLAVAIGIPFFVSSTSAPLLQKWFAYTGHPSARDPYFLYAASNAGSLISLLGYPFIIEPNLTLVQQAWVWAVGFVVLVGLVVVCGKAAANPVGVPPLSVKLAESRGERGPAGPAAVSEPPPSWVRVMKWIALAFVPSSLMLGVTFYMTTDIASIPLLWVIPLALYLVTFIIAFGRVPAWFRLVIGNLAPVVLLLLIFVTVAHDEIRITTGIELAVHIAAFFALSLMCHYELARDRPKDVTYLTGYFLCMSVGGVLGGIFNALVAPVVFDYQRPLEYVLSLVAAAFMVPRLDDNDSAERVRAGNPMPPTELEAYKAKVARILDFVLPGAVGLGFWIMVAVVAQRDEFKHLVLWVKDKTPLSSNAAIAILAYAVPVMACFFLVDRPRRFGLAVALLLAIHLYLDRDPGIVYTERSFFGILKVEQRGYQTRLVHGTTLHGTQFNEPYLSRFDTPVPFGSFSPWDVLALEGSLAAWSPREEPLTYYHRTGPVGAMFREVRTRKGGADARLPVAMVGLGTGSVSCYALPGQKLTFYEIDPAVKRLVADDDKYFTYVKDAERRGATLDFRMGDARLKLAEDADRKYALLLVDAFSSDSIPVHLLTKQAVKMYMDRLTDDGILALHISNKYVQLEPVVAKIAADPELKLAARVWNDSTENRPGKTASSWVVLARDEKTLGSLAAPAVEQARMFGTKNQVLLDLLKRYDPATSAKDVLTKEYGADFAKNLAAENQETKEGGLAIKDFTERHGPQAAILAEYVRKNELTKKNPTLGDMTEYVFGKMFRPLDPPGSVRLWTDDFTDVLQVMSLKEVQWLRRVFGLPTPGDGVEE